MHDFQGYFSRIFLHLKLQFAGPSESWNFQEKIQDFPEGVESWEPCTNFLISITYCPSQRQLAGQSF